MNLPSVSIVIPCFNHAQWLPSCLATIAAQGIESELEVIIVNDGSTDDFLQVSEELKNRYRWLKVINNTERLGQAASRNLGAEKASNDYLMFLDADDELIDSVLLEMLQWMARENISAEAVIAGIQVVYKNGQIKKRPAASFTNSAAENLELYISGKTYFNQGSYLIKKSSFLSIKFDETLKIKEDALFFMNMLLKCSVVDFGKPMVNYFLNRGTVRSNKEEYLKIGFQVEDSFFADPLSQQLPQKLKNKIYLRRCNRLMKDSMEFGDFKKAVQWHREVVARCPSLMCHHRLLRKSLQSSLLSLFKP